MGWVTNRSKSWELKNMWGVFLTFLFSILVFSGLQSAFIIAMGFSVKKRSWIIFAIINYIITMLYFFLFLLLFKNINTFVQAAWFVFPFINCLFAAFISKEYLQRLDLQLLGKTLEWGKTYPYDKDIPESIEIKQLSEAEEFSIVLLKWQDKIDELSIKKDIDKMLTLIKVIGEKDNTESAKFFARHTNVVEKMLRQYDELENTNLDNEIIKKSKDKLTESIHLATKGFENELTLLFKSEILDVDAETEAYLQNLKNKNII
ncbi:hypothetical protein SAMN05421738_1054 [Algoriella xinjiangensis]|uniref:5-bromo-4-chloroindolyl phosphate hydrolysis protein n=1 Tax=Algoriella xinjiangensis TaxID=684065 RepID=A0A1I4V8T5_9FLAO|nr:hypothetical protein [Algoriella xinjiangensis]SFM97607.1 hypothetical protein SAMN05421738_1054 [Algoriella xinjiangensis]VDH17045.1 Uncharacterised protein [Algoriella xinjiangensis]